MSWLDNIGYALSNAGLMDEVEAEAIEGLDLPDRVKDKLRLLLAEPEAVNEESAVVFGDEFNEICDVLAGEARASKGL